MLVHDWPQDAVGQAIPYGFYEITRTHGYVVIGDCFDTPRFAVEAISNWWWQDGQRAFPNADRLLVLADAGGSNSCRSRVWRAQIQEQLCDAFGLEVTVCHYPTGCRGGNEQGEAVSNVDMQACYSPGIPPAHNGTTHCHHGLKPKSWRSKFLTCPKHYLGTFDAVLRRL